MNIFQLAWRNIGRNRRRTISTVGAMALALLLCVLYSTLVTGMVNGMEEGVVEVGVGDIQLHEPGYLDRPSIYDRIQNVDALIDTIHSHGFLASPRLTGSSLLAANDTAIGGALYGVDTVLDSQVSIIPDRVDEGQWLDPSDPNGVVVGRRAARALSLEVGDELVALGQAADGSMANDLFTVRGILSPISDGIDRAGVFLHTGTFRDYFVVPTGVHQIILRRPSGEELDPAAATVAALAPHLDVKTWRQLNPTFAQFMDAASQAVFIIAFILYLLVAIVIVNAMLMSVFERIKEFGVLKAIGVGPYQVVSLILVETLMQAAIATAIGAAVGGGLVGYFQSIGGIPIDFMAGMSLMGQSLQDTLPVTSTAAALILPVILLVVFAFLSAIYPAIKAARISPVEAMQHQ